MNRVVDNTMRVEHDDILVVGSGIGGLVCALSLAPRAVTLITKTPKLQSGSSLWAQGGIAAAVGPDDSPQAHAADTLSAGAGLSDPRRARQLTDEGAASLDWLVREGIPFDRDVRGELALAKEAAHQFPRVVHAGGDTTGYVLVNSLIDRVAATPSVKVLEDTLAYELVVEKGRVHGLITFSRDNGWVFHKAPQVVLATGGVGMAWWHTTNPVEATGDGLAIAARAGVKLTNMEFVQFHPTALAIESRNGASLPLLTEALRGAGALLLDEQGNRFMVSEHPAAELAPRDVVARCIEKRTSAGQTVYLDLRPVLSGERGQSFPKAIQTATDAGFDPYTEPLPITPAAHYHMGGIEVDSDGRTSIDGLWACGEVATTGIHGANRLASNSLLEALVWARRVAAKLASESMSRDDVCGKIPPVPRIPGVAAAVVRRKVDATRKIMSQHVGIVRSGDDLGAAYDALSAIDKQFDDLLDVGAAGTPARGDAVRRWAEARNLILVARLIAFSALRREESRGAHYRDDYPVPRPEWRRHQSLTVDTLVEAH